MQLSTERGLFMEKIDLTLAQFLSLSLIVILSIYPEEKIFVSKISLYDIELDRDDFLWHN